MAMTEGTAVSSGNTAGGLFGGITKLGELYIDYTRAKRLDVETPNDDDNIPDKADLAAGNTMAGRDALGGIFNHTIGGLNAMEWVMVAAALGATVYTLKKLEVF